MSDYLYYPGCSIKGTGKAYEESLLAVFDALDTKMDEIDDWNCCGATAYMGIDESQAFALAGRNLALATDGGRDVVAPCSACYLVLNKTKRYLNEYPKMRARVQRAIQAAGLEYDSEIKVRHPLDVLVNDVGLDTIRARVERPLKGLKVAAYYGCQIVRPFALFDSQYKPRTMDDLLEAVGATMADYTLKTRCCGGSQTGTLPEVGLHSVYLLLKEATRLGADVIATVCPLCQFNLEAYQDEVAAKYDVQPIPVLYFTQLLGYAFGLSNRQIGLQRAMVPAEPVLERRTAHVA